MKRRLTAAVVLLLLLPLGLLAVELDLWTAASYYFLFHLAFLTASGCIGLVAAAIAHEKWPFIPAALLALLLALLPLVDLGPVKPFVRAARAIVPGMTEAQVRAVVDSQFPPNGRFRHPVGGRLEGDLLGFVLDPSDARYNAAILEVRFEAGLSKTAHFSPD